MESRLTLSSKIRRWLKRWRRRFVLSGSLVIRVKVSSKELLNAQLNAFLCSPSFLRPSPVFLLLDPEKRIEFRRLAMGRLLEDLNTRLTTKSTFQESDPLKLAVYSAHDTSLAGLLSTLDCFDNRWPSFTASVGIELWKDTRPEVQPGLFNKFGYMLGISNSEVPHYVRMRYGDKTLRVPACSQPGKHFEGSPELCTLDAFRDIVKGLRHPKGLNWEQQCDVGRGERSSK